MHLVGTEPVFTWGLMFSHILRYYTGRNGTTSPHFEVAPHSCNIILVGMGQPVFYSYVEIMIMICFEMYDKCYKKGESVLSNKIEKLELKENLFLLKKARHYMLPHFSLYARWICFSRFFFYSKFYLQIQLMNFFIWLEWILLSIFYLM